MSGAPGALPGYRGGSGVFRLDADAPRDRYPEACGAQALFSLSPQSLGRAGKHPRSPVTQVYVTRAANLSLGEHPGTNRCQAPPRERPPLGRTRTAAEGLDPGALPMRWGEEMMGVFSAMGIMSGLSPTNPRHPRPCAWDP